MPDLSVVIVSYNTAGLLRRCLDALFASADGVDLDVIVVDNASRDGTLAMLADAFPMVRVIANTANVGFAAANNQGLAAARADAALLLNSDAFVSPGDLTRGMQLLAERPDIGLLGVRLLNPDGSVQAEGGTDPTFWDDVAAAVGLDRVLRRRGTSRSGTVDWVQGACMFVRRAALEQVGLLDTRYFMYSEEVDWCRRFRLHGWKVWYAADIAVVHLGGGSSGNDLRRRAALYRSRLGYRRRAGGPAAALALWALTVAGLGARIVARSLASRTLRRPLGRQTPSSDLALLRAVLRMDPLARWSTA